MRQGSILSISVIRRILSMLVASPTFHYIVKIPQICQNFVKSYKITFLFIFLLKLSGKILENIFHWAFCCLQFDSVKGLLRLILKSMSYLTVIRKLSIYC